MFSTVDRLGNRFLRCTLITDGREFRAEIPSSMQPQIGKLISIPTPELLSDFARRLMEVSWEPLGESGNPETSSGKDGLEPGYKLIARGESYGYSSERSPVEAGDAAIVVGARVEVMRLVFDSREQRLSAEKILGVTERRVD